MQKYKRIPTYGRGLMKLNHRKNLLYVVMNKNNLKDVQQDQEKVINLY